MSDKTALFFDRQEVRPPAEREQAIFHALPGLLRHAIDNAPGISARLAGIDPDMVVSRDALQRIPILNLATIGTAQRTAPPFGGMVATPIGRLARIATGMRGQFVPEGARVDYWRLARAMFAAGVRRTDLVWNACEHQFQTFASMAETGARALGCTVVPAGADDAHQVADIRALQPCVFIGSERVLDELQRELGAACPFRCAILTEDGADPPPSGRSERFHVFATDEAGLVAYETKAHAGLVVDESVIVEIVDPATGRPAADGRDGEIVVTVFNPDYPLLRLATGFVARVLPGESPCGRTNRRISRPRPLEDRRAA